jgi:hypothetical protein
MMSDMTVYCIVFLITKYVADCPSVAPWGDMENMLHTVVYFRNTGMEAELLYH